MKEKIKAFFASKKAKVAAIATPVMTAVAAVPTFAADSGSTVEYGTKVSDAMVSAVNSIVTNTVNMAAAVLPVALTVLGLYMTVKAGINFIHSTMSKH